MKISIITVTYNSEKTIEDTLKSIQSQTYKNFEHIVIDGASTDGTLNIVRSFSNTIVSSEPDNGIYDAMNKGLKLVSGDIIGILNSDDFYSSSNVLQLVVDAFCVNNIDSVYGDLQYVSQNNLNKVVRYWKAGRFKRERFLNGWMPPHPTFFVKRKCYQKYGCFDLDFDSAADYELMLRFLFKHQITTDYIPEVLIKMRVGGKSNASLMNRYRANKEDKLAWKKNGLKPKFYTTWLKPLIKIKQYF